MRDADHSPFPQIANVANIAVGTRHKKRLAHGDGPLSPFKSPSQNGPIVYTSAVYTSYDNSSKCQSTHFIHSVHWHSLNLTQRTTLPDGLLSPYWTGPTVHPDFHESHTTLMRE